MDRVRDLLKRGLGSCSIDTLGPEGDTLLHLACLYDSEACARLLLDHGACATVRDEDQSTSLHDASASGCVFLPHASAPQ